MYNLKDLIKATFPLYEKRSNQTSGNSQSGFGVIGVRTLTIRQLKEVIEEIYKSKQMFDKKYLEA